MNIRNYNMSEKLQNLIIENPHYVGLFMIVVGIVGVVIALNDVNWLFGDRKIEGLVNFFGWKAVRIISGVFSSAVFLAGLIWFLVGTFRK